MDNIDLFVDLERWQASSHPSLADRRPEELFETSFVERYYRLHRDLWHRLIRVHGTIASLERLRSFPFDLVYGPSRMEFWRLVIENFLDTAILILNGLVNDSGKDVHTLVTFRTDIISGSWLRKEDCEQLKETLRKRRFDAEINSIAERVQSIRDSRIAHVLVDRKTGHFDETMTGVSLDELRQLFDATHRIFGALSFGGVHLTLVGDLTPATIGGKPQPTCLDTVLDAVLRESVFVNMPERQPELWAMERSHMHAKELRTVNELRRQIGLEEA